MLFNSFSFLILFLPTVLLGYYLLVDLGRGQVARYWLLLSSLLFYAIGRVADLPLLLGSILFNYLFGRAIGSSIESKKKLWLWLGLGGNVLFLSTFKYANLFLGALSHVVPISMRLPNWEFPLGISFFTLQQVMYLVDCYEGLIAPSTLLSHAQFVSFFAYVSSGPIARARTMVKQFEQGPVARNRSRDLSQGLTLLILGLFKKVVFADSFRRLADPGFSSPYLVSTLEAWVCSVCYALQIYFDFSGYSDIAMSVALMIGYDIPINFDAPYRSTSISEFWRRWHITLSNFITTYLYTPIVRSFRRVTVHTSAVATIAAMLIAGLWHGPYWTFVIFGGLHGLGLAINQYWKKRKWKLPDMVAWSLTSLLILIAFIFFRSSTVLEAVHMCRMLLPSHDLLSVAVIHATMNVQELSMVAGPVMVGAVLSMYGKTSTQLMQEFEPSVRCAMQMAFLLIVVLVFLNSTVAQDFIYFQF